ncbi:MAG: NHL repeat-containing protein [Deltaproteobacteria bacterium CSP1-8]|nr:MAG: NHL repeat-containing protein [Deltaproteobacteria bacterium CSP1-8]
MILFPFRFRHTALLALFGLGLATSGCGDTNVGKAASVAALAGAAGGPGFFDGSPADPVRFDSPSGVAVVGTDRFVADTANHVIRKIDAAGNLTTFSGAFGIAGSADGTGAAARFRSPTAIVADGNTLYVSDTGNHTIRRISAGAVVTTLAGSPGTPGSADNVSGPGNVLFSSPAGITFDGATSLYVADTGNHTVRRLFPSGATTTFAGQAGVPGSADGLGPAARFSSPGGIALIGTGLLYVADTGNHTIRQVVVTAAFGDVTTLAGTSGTPGSADGTGPLARFRSPSGMTSDGTSLFLCDTGNHTVRNVTQSGVVTTLAGFAGTPGFAEGTGQASLFRSPSGIGTAPGGSSLFVVADTGNHVVRQVTAAGVATTLAGNPPRTGGADGTGGTARFSIPAGVAVVGDNVFVTDTGNHTIRKVTSAGTVSTLAGVLETPGSADGTGPAAQLRFPGGIAALGGDLFVTDSGNHTIRKVTAGGLVTTIAGTPGATGSVDGTGTGARFNNPQGIVALGGDLYVADTGNHTIRKVTTAGAVTTLSGSPGTPGSSDGAGGTARFSSPLGIAAIGTNLYVADTGNHDIRRVATPSGASSTFAGAAGQPGFADGQGASARFSSPDGIAAADSVLYVADRGNHAVRRISSTRDVTTFAGDPGAATTRNGLPSVALMNAPTGIAGVPGTIYFTDVNENVVRKILF